MEHRYPRFPRLLLHLLRQTKEKNDLDELYELQNYHIMNLVNRGFVFVRPRAAFVAWARQIDPEMLIDEHAEGSIYLIEEEFWDDELVLKNYANKIAAHEFSCITEDQTLWASWTTIEDLEALFEIEMGCTCIDLLAQDLAKEKI